MVGQGRARKDILQDMNLNTKNVVQSSGRDSRHTDHPWFSQRSTPKPLPKTPASPDFFLLVSQPPTQMPSHRASTKDHIPLPFTGTSGPAGHPFPAVFQPDERSPARQARHSRSVLELHARVRVLSSSTEKTRGHSRDVDHLAA